jgi:hypothetical protein
MSLAKLGMVTFQGSVRISTDIDGTGALRSRDMEGNVTPTPLFPVSPVESVREDD